LKSVRGAHPKDIRFRLRLGLAQIGDTGIGLLAVNDDCDTRMFPFKSFLVGLKQLLGKRGDDDDFFCQRRIRNKIKDGPNQPEADPFHKTSYRSRIKKQHSGSNSP
jgi:hypothetical protein